MKKIIISALLVITALVAGCKTTTGAARFEGKTDSQLYQEGVKNVKKSRYQAAVSRFEALDALYPFSSYTQRGQLQIIYAYYKSEDWASATAAADRYIHLYPRSKNVDYAYYIKGLSNMKRNRTWVYRFFPVSASKRDLSGMREAFNDFNQLIYIFPKSSYAEDARKRMIYIRDILAHHEMHIADFYFKRKAYVAAANRSSYIVRHFEGSRFVKDALRIMVKSYAELGKKDLENDARQVFKNTYPTSTV